MIPENRQRTPSYAIDDGENTSLGCTFKAQLEQHRPQSGVHLLGNGLDAFVGRAMSAALAGRSIDIQYYMFHQDTVGRLLIRELIQAADRCVRVRMLIDDIYGGQADDVWLALDSHRNVEVRLFNPFDRGYSKTLQFVTRLKTVNHRMHSKTFTVDNQLAIVGGRNIGDEYFDADRSLAFADMDVMAIGPVVREVSQEFDQYWNSRLAYPVVSLGAAAQAGALDKLRRDLDAFYTEKQTSAYIDALENSPFALALKTRSAQFGFAPAKIIHDAPEKLHRADGWKGELLISQLAPYIQQATEEFILVSPYFVPGQRGADALSALSQKGVAVRILTNSLVSNDVAAVHAGYMRHREQLVRSGIHLYELDEQIKKKEAERFTWLPGLSRSSLHAKTMAIDRKIMFVGSFNFDQRSLFLNNEIGILFHEPELAANASRHFNEHVENVAFKVELEEHGNDTRSLKWTTVEDGKKVIFDSDPYAGFWKRLEVNMMRVLPIDSML
jgi:putative cardiolipin synthase